MKLRMVDVRCPECGFEGEHLVDMEDSENLCNVCHCSLLIVNTFGAPLVLQASYPDGKCRGDDWKRAKAALDVEIAGLNKTAEDKKLASKEIKKIWKGDT